MTSEQTKGAKTSKDVASQASVDSTEDVPPSSFSNGDEPIQDVLINEEAENQKANRTLRSTYADKAHNLAANCIKFWAAAISINAITYGITGRLIISDTALIAITSGVTINVLAAFLGVIRGLFPSEPPKKKETKKRQKAPKPSGRKRVMPRIVD